MIQLCALLAMTIMMRLTHQISVRLLVVFSRHDVAVVGIHRGLHPYSFRVLAG